MKNKRKGIYIWGAGKVGEAAIRYYKDDCDIIGIVDSNVNKYGRMFHGYSIKNPRIITENPLEVVIALRNGVQDVIEKLKKMGIYEPIIFDYSEKKIQSDSKSILYENKAVVVRFFGGLGNQMFHYVVYRHHELKNHLLYAEDENDVISKVFPNIVKKNCSCQAAREFILDRIKDGKTGLFTIYRELHTYECDRKEKNDLLLDLDCAYLQGNFQIAAWVNSIEEDLRNQFIFRNKIDNGLKKLIEEIEQCRSSVSIHIRRGDYLDNLSQVYYGDICTDEYYNKAVQYMKKHVEGSVFYVFSNEIEWVKNNMEIPNAHFISSKMFEDYEDWYDMYLMSLCKHNIIANSTFSWWGAWLNNNPQKTVVAPAKWINNCEYPDVYPEEWIKISNSN